MMTHKHFKIRVNGPFDVDIIDPRWPNKPIHNTEGALAAVHFIDGYRAGYQWAVDALMYGSIVDKRPKAFRT